MDLMEHFRKFNLLSHKVTNTWVHDVPEGSMAFVALKNRILTEEKMGIPLQLNGSTQYKLDVEQLDPCGMLRILTRVNTLVKEVAKVLGTSVRANIITSNSDGQPYLLTYFDDLPFAIFGGYSKISPNCVDNPPLTQIFESWRLQFLRSFRRIVPPPLYQRILKNIDGMDDLDWSLRLVRSSDFVEIVHRVMNLEKSHGLSRIFSLCKEDFNKRNAELTRERSQMFKIIEEESRTFWTYEKIGHYLRM